MVKNYVVPVHTQASALRFMLQIPERRILYSNYIYIDNIFVNPHQTVIETIMMSCRCAVVPSVPPIPVFLNNFYTIVFIKSITRLCH